MGDVDVPEDTSASPLSGVCCAGVSGQVMAASQQLLYCWFVLSYHRDSGSLITLHCWSQHSAILFII